MASAAMPLPPGAKLVQDEQSQGMKLPPGAKLVQDTPAAPESHPIRDFLGNAAQALNPVPAIKEFMNRPSEIGKASDALGAFQEADKSGKPMNASQNARVDAGMNAKLPGAEGNALTETGAGGVQGVTQMRHGDVAGGLGTIAGSYAPLATPMAMKGVGKMVGGLAPDIAEMSQGVRNVDRDYSRAPGRAILDETKGVRSGTIRDSARAKLSDINGQLDKATASAPGPIDLRPARGVIDSDMVKATGQNNGLAIKQMTPMVDQLTKRIPEAGGGLIPDQVPPPEYLNLKRGFDDQFISNWDSTRTPGSTGTAKKAYHQMANDFHAGVPGSAELDSRASNLIPVAKRAAQTDLNSNNPAMGILGRMKAHTGALTGMVSGAGAGYATHGGIGALLGGLAGILGPEIIGNPTAQMVAARTLNGTGKAIANPAVGRTLAAASMIKSRQKQDQ